MTARSEVSMGLPASQRRILERIENALRGSDPRLAALFSIFTRLNRGEQMPRAEQLRARAGIILARLGYRLAPLSPWLPAPAPGPPRTPAVGARSGRGVGRLSSVGLAASEMHGRGASSAPRRGAETQPRLA